MKNAIKFSKYLLMSLLTIFIISCDGKDGVDGIDGINGAAGPAGANGADGEDGNANVLAFTFDLSTAEGASITQDIPELTQEVLDNDLVLGYLKASEEFNPIPAPVFLVAAGNFKDIAVDLKVGEYWLFFYERGTENLSSVSAGSLDQLKVIIAKSTSTTAGKSDTQGAMAELKSAGVDVGDYYAVMDYYGMDY